MNIEERLTRLERENRRLKVAALVLVAVIASAFLMGQARPPSELVAQRFTLVNGDGVRIGELKDVDGLPYFILYEPSQMTPAINMGLATTQFGDQPKRTVGPYLTLS